MAPVFLTSLDALFDHIDIQAHRRLSFHHHLRNGDFVLNKVLGYYRDHQVSSLHLFPSSIFPNHTSILELLQDGRIDSITTNYMNGPVADYISTHGLPGELRMQTHGGRARNILDGTTIIDIAYLAAPTVDRQGNAIGWDGPSRCGSLGYAVPDSRCATITVLVTDHVVEDPMEHPEIQGNDVDYVVVIDKIGDPTGIVSGTTRITTDPINVKIARDTARLLDALGVIRDGFSYQSGAGGTSLRVTSEVRDLMRRDQVTASFMSGGITSFHVRMLEEGLVQTLYDVQCFDLDAVDSLKRNKNHIAIDASMYANPAEPKRVIRDLDVVILGATEMDLAFNVNVTTDSHGTIIGGSGGHSDTAQEAGLTVIVAPSMRSRLPLIRNRVTTITTPGSSVDVLVTERGIAIHPSRTDLIERLKDSNLPICSIQDLQKAVHAFTGVPRTIQRTGRIIGVVEDRTQRVIDTIRQTT